MMKRFVVAMLLSLLAVGIAFAQTDATKQAPAKKPATTTGKLPGAPVKGEPTTLPDGLQYWDLVVGTGPEAAKGDKVYVHYTGWLLNGKMFDTSLQGKNPKPFDFTIDNDEVIKGWDEGVTGMKVGGKRKLNVPAKLAYGAEGVRDPATRQQIIPQNATLVFDVSLVRIKGKK